MLSKPLNFDQLLLTETKEVGKMLGRQVKKSSGPALSFLIQRRIQDLRGGGSQVTFFLTSFNSNFFDIFTKFPRRTSPYIRFPVLSRQLLLLVLPSIVVGPTEPTQQQHSSSYFRR